MRAVLSHGLSPRKPGSVSRFSGPPPVHPTGCTPVAAHIQRSTLAFRHIPSQHYHVLVGLLNRCARLMLSNIALSHEGKFGETTAIIDRCIFETAVKLTWLCID